MSAQCRRVSPWLSVRVGHKPMSTHLQVRRGCPALCSPHRSTSTRASCAVRFCARVLLCFRQDGMCCARYLLLMSVAVLFASGLFTRLPKADPAASGVLVPTCATAQAAPDFVTANASRVRCEWPQSHHSSAVTEPLEVRRTALCRTSVSSVGQQPHNRVPHRFHPEKRYLVQPPAAPPVSA